MLEKKAFDKDYVLLEEMYLDPFFPDQLVDKIKSLLNRIVEKLEAGETSNDKIQEELDSITVEINNLQEEFYDNNSEIEALARDSIARTLSYILSYFHIRIDIEDALRLREW